MRFGQRREAGGQSTGRVFGTSLAVTYCLSIEGRGAAYLDKNSTNSSCHPLHVFRLLRLSEPWAFTCHWSSLNTDLCAKGTPPLSTTHKPSRPNNALFQRTNALWTTLSIAGRTRGTLQPRPACRPGWAPRVLPGVPAPTSPSPGALHCLGGNGQNRGARPRGATAAEGVRRVGWDEKHGRMRSRLNHAWYRARLCMKQHEVTHTSNTLQGAHGAAYHLVVAPRAERRAVHRCAPL